jgi:hypothetical protein
MVFLFSIVAASTVSAASHRLEPLAPDEIQASYRILTDDFEPLLRAQFAKHQV